MQPWPSIDVQRFCRVLGQVARGKSSFFERARADRKIPKKLDVNVPTTPHVADKRLLDVTADREMRVEAMTPRMPLRHPEIRNRLAAKLTAKPLEKTTEINP
jgi:hypothetical protein